MSVADVIEGRARWHVEAGDCRAWLATLGDGCMAHALTDPPYDAKTHAGARTMKDGGRATPIDFAALGDMTFVPEMLRVTRRWVVAFCAMRQFAAYEAASGEAWIRDGIWHRTDSAPQFTGDRPAQGCEGVAIMHRRGRKRWNGGGHQAFWRGPVEHSDRAHPTQKPLWIMLELVSLFTDPDDIILDPFAGSGTTGVAALRLGRRFIGCELDPKYHAVAVERLTAEERGTTLQAQRAGQGVLFDTIGGPR